MTTAFYLKAACWSGRLAALIFYLLIQTELHAQTVSTPCMEATTNQPPPPEEEPGTASRPGMNTSCTWTSWPFTYLFAPKENFIPYATSTAPATVPKKIKLRFVIPETNNTGPVKTNFRPEDTYWLNMLITWMNIMSADILAPSNPATSIFIKNERLQYELVEIDFVDDPNTYESGPNYFDQGVSWQGKYKDSILNVYFHNDIGATGSGAWTYFGYELLSPVYENNSYLEIFYRNLYKVVKNMSPADFEGTMWGASNTLMHEIHHCLGLGHLQADSPGNYGKDNADPWGGSGAQCTGPDYLADCYPAPAGCPLPLTDHTTHNIMASGNIRNYISPYQMGRVHRNAYLSRVSQYIYPVELPTEHPWEVTDNQLWDFPVHMYQDIIVKPGATLTLTCKILMPHNGRIIVQPGGKLIIDGGVVTSYHAKSTWGGIRSMGNMTYPSQAVNQGYVELKNGAIVENATEGVWNFSHENGYQGGGIIKASSSYFYNCWRAVGLNGYGFHSYGNLFSGTTNCSFDHVEFITDERSPFLIKHNWYMADQFTSFDTKNGVSITNCTFKNEVPYDKQPQDKRGRCIHVVGTGIKVENTTFENFKVGINSIGYTGISTRNTYVYDNTFTGVTNSIILAGDAYGDVRGNYINTMKRSGLLAPPVGIYLDNSRGSFVGCGNYILGYGSTPTFYNNTVGIIVNNSAWNASTVTRNELTELTYGVRVQRHNPYLDVTCNQFESNYTGWSINPIENGAFYSLKNQGTGCQPGQTRAGNVFSNNTRDIMSSLQSIWAYYAFKCNTNDSQYPFINSANFILSNCDFGNATSDPNSQCSKFWTCIRMFEVPQPQVTFQHAYSDLVAAGMKTSQEAQLVKGMLIRSYAQLEDNAGLQTFLETENDDESRRQLIPLYIETGQYTKAVGALSQLAIPNNEKDAYTAYYTLLGQLHHEGRSIKQLDAEELQLVQSLAADNLEVSAYARGILDAAYDQPWEHEVEEETPVAPKAAFSTVTTASSTLYDAVPNPASNQTVVRVFITEKDAQHQPVLTVCNTMGVVVASYPLTDGENTITVETGRFSAGLYTYSLSLNGEVQETKKLSILK